MKEEEVMLKTEADDYMYALNNYGSSVMIQSFHEITVMNVNRTFSL